MKPPVPPPACGGRIPLGAAIMGGLIAFLATCVAGWLDGLQPAQIFLRAGLGGFAMGSLGLIIGKLGTQVVLEPARSRPAESVGAAVQQSVNRPGTAAAMVETPVGPLPLPSAVAGGPGATGPPRGAGPPSGPGMRG